MTVEKKYVMYYYNAPAPSQALLDTEYAVVCTFFDSQASKKEQKKAKALQAALDYGQIHGTQLLIASFNHGLHSKQFCLLLLDYLKKGGEVICLDHPDTQRDTLLILLENTLAQRSLHGTLIKQGLTRSQARSGNPKAKSVIARINRPKVDNAIVFALLLKPIIHHYQQRGYSQRRMVSALNYEKIHAPEGGPWVLSQLQKVLERIKVNDAAYFIKNQHPEPTQLSCEEVLPLLQKSSLSVPRGKEWTEELCSELLERVQQLSELKQTNALLLDLLPVLKSTPVDNLQAQWLYHAWQRRTTDVPTHACF